MTYTEKFQQQIAQQLQQMDQQGLRKNERVIGSQQRAHVRVGDRTVLNLCANNYLGLADDPRIVAAAHEAVDAWGYGLCSVRFICGTQRPHRELEIALSEFLGTQDTILYGSCFDANGGLFETLLTEQDAIVSDELNHASIIDGIRLCKAKRFRYLNNNMADLKAKLDEARAAGARNIMIATDGVFSMDGYIANLPGICDLAEQHGALVMVDDSHAVGFTGEQGRGTHELHGVIDRVDILTGTLGKALGGASGGYTSGKKEIIDLLRQRSRPYLFSNSVPPVVVGASLKALQLVRESAELREKLRENTAYFRSEMSSRGFDILPGEHPIVPVMFGDAVKAQSMAAAMLEAGVYVVAFSYPVVPMGKARIRTQVSAAHSRADLEFAVNRFTHCREKIGT